MGEMNEFADGMPLVSVPNLSIQHVCHHALSRMTNPFSSKYIAMVMKWQNRYGVFSSQELLNAAILSFSIGISLFATLQSDRKYRQGRLYVERRKISIKKFDNS